MTSGFYKQFYIKGSFAYKAVGILAFCIRRLAELVQVGHFDIVVVQREAMLIGPPIVEWAVSRVWRKPLIFDFDDSIFLHADTSLYKRWSKALKMPNKTKFLIKSSDHIVVCDEYLREYAVTQNANTTIIPTVVDAEKFSPAHRTHHASPPTIGWVGSHSTAAYLIPLLPVFEELGRRHRFRLKIVGAGHQFKVPGVEVLNVPWSLEGEVLDFADLDIGIYPLPDNAWTRGKTGFKPIQYMAMGIPAVCSPVGGVCEFIRGGENGLLPLTQGDWIEKLSALIVDDQLRKSIGDKGRKTVEEWYCVQRQSPRLRAILETVLAARA
jgi:glycosyltransferase involved in cell wall biosynthesis